MKQAGFPTTRHCPTCTCSTSVAKPERPKLKLTYYGLLCPEHGLAHTHMAVGTAPSCWMCDLKYSEAHIGCGGEIWDGKCHKCDEVVR